MLNERKEFEAYTGKVKYAAGSKREYASEKEYAYENCRKNLFHCFSPFLPYTWFVVIIL